MAAWNVDYEGEETRSVSSAAAVSPDPFRLSVRASLPASTNHCIHGCRLGIISRVSTYIAENRILEEPFVVCSYLLLSCFGMGQMALEGREDSVVGGSLLSVFMMFGLSMGSFASLGWMLLD